ncbi:MAG: ribonuclease J [Holosporales bacterium]|jgi:ribonuclease J|nr:ribonuclease J [Holosporales bacterium]
MSNKKKKVSLIGSSALFCNPTKDDIFFISLGGTDEIGLNFALIGHDGEWLIIDCGIAFYDQLGVEVLTADPSFIVRNNLNLVGLLVTHAHEDHIGAIEYLWPLLKCPIYVSSFANAVLMQKIRHKQWKAKARINEIKFNSVVSIGKFRVECVQMTHSIPEPVCFVIKTQLGTLVHSGDWKWESAPVIGSKINEQRLKQIGDDGVLAYFSDSTNIFTKEDNSSEQQTRDCIFDLVKKYENKRITIACFSSNIARLESAFLAADNVGRKVVVIGLSLQRMIAAARETGFLKDFNNLIDEKAVLSVPSEKILLLCTGSQGEGKSALVRLANGKHPVIKFGNNDLVLFSSRVIPGNEKSIGKLQSLLAQTGADIITSSEECIHASGHPSCNTIKKMYDTLRPKIVVPVHGEARHLIAQSHFAKAEGIPYVITPVNGSVIQLAGNDPRIIGTVKCGKWAVDGNRMIDFYGNVIKERSSLAEHGAIFVTVICDKNGVNDVNVRLIGVMAEGNLYEEMKKCVVNSVGKFFAGSALDSVKDNTNRCAKTILQVVKSKIGKFPVVEVHAVNVDE